ncbi:hypothetical protein ACH5RR_012877 [Cinchona calisaya]|uniref:Uncharacterized protein n=1 Tax=Cinchona calisaya TaxID=153742 RepID=A0ABD3ABD6_9GENT
MDDVPVGGTKFDVHKECNVVVVEPIGDDQEVEKDSTGIITTNEIKNDGDEKVYDEPYEGFNNCLMNFTTIIRCVLTWYPNSCILEENCVSKVKDNTQICQRIF